MQWISQFMEVDSFNDATHQVGWNRERGQKLFESTLDRDHPVDPLLHHIMWRLADNDTLWRISQEQHVRPGMGTTLEGRGVYTRSTSVQPARGSFHANFYAWALAVH